MMNEQNGGNEMFLDLTHKVDGKAVLVNIDLVRYVYPMAEGCDLIFDPHHSASVLESPAEIQQLLGGKKRRARRAPVTSVDASLQAIVYATSSGDHNA